MRPLLKFWSGFWVVAALFGAVLIARADVLPSNSNLQFQTSSRNRPPTIGDWYTTATSSSTDRVHRILIEVSQGLLNANGGSINVQVFDADNRGNLDETDGVLNNAAGTPDPARFELRATGGVTVLQSQTVSSSAPDGTTLTFPISTPGSYQLVIVNGAFPVSGDATANLNDDDNTYSVSIPGNSTLIGQFQGTFAPVTAFSTLNFYFLVGPGQANLRLRNFDLDLSGASPSIAYTRPGFGATPASTIAGTASGNGVWNNGGTLNVGEDTVAISQNDPYPDAGQWGLTVNNVGASNQFALEANAGTQRLVLLDQPPTTADAGNWRITPDGTLPGAVGSPTTHYFSITNFFFTTDIINLALSGTSPNYTTQLFDASTNTLLTDGDSDGRVDTGILQPGQTKNYYLRVTPQIGAGPSDTTRINSTSLMDARVAPGTITTLFVQKTTQLTNTTNISGTVYLDGNHNSVFDDAEEGLPNTGLFVKLVPAAGGNAVAAVAVSDTSGNYQFLGVTPANYTLVLDNNNTLTDTTPTVPPSTTGTEAPNGTRAVTVPQAGTTNQNFGRFTGETLRGRVFRDDGGGGGIANNGILDGGEVGISGVALRLQNAAGSTTFDSAITDASGNYTLSAPLTGASLRVIETNASSFRSTGAQVGNTGGTYSLASDAIAFPSVAGTPYSGVNFGDVPPSLFTIDNIRTAAPGETVFLPHVFTAGTAGNLAFTLTATANPSTGWSNVLYRDTNGDGVLQPGEPQITAPIAVTTGQSVAVLLKVFTPLGASLNASEAILIGANLAYANAPGNIESLSRTDLVTISTGSGLILTKSVDKTTARAGDDITYTINFLNSGNDTIANIVVSDATPAYCVFRSASTGVLPANLTTPTTSFPALNTAGPLRWTFGGTLAPGRSGSVSFVVRLQ